MLMNSHDYDYDKEDTGRRKIIQSVSGINTGPQLKSKE